MRSIVKKISKQSGKSSKAVNYFKKSRQNVKASDNGSTADQDMDNEITEVTNGSQEPDDSECEAVPAEQRDGAEATENTLDSTQQNEPIESQGISAPSLNELREKFRLFREDVLVYAYTNSTRLELIEEITGKMVIVADNTIKLVERLSKERCEE